MKSDIDMAVQWSKRLEALLEKGCGATGRGLHEKLDSVQDHLPGGLVRRLRFIATVRNKIVHEADYERIEDRAGFERACAAAEAELASAANTRRGAALPRQAGPDIAPTPGALRPSRRGVRRWVGGGRGRSHRESGANRSASLERFSPWFAVVGGIAGGAVPMIQGMEIMYAVFGAVLGAAAGIHWLWIMRLLGLALIASALVWIIVQAYGYLYPAG